MAETSKTFKRKLSIREEWIRDFLNMSYGDNKILQPKHCKELADLLKQNITPAKIIAYLRSIRINKHSNQKGMTLNNEEIWMFKKEDILKLGEVVDYDMGELLIRKEGQIEPAGLYDICEHFINQYPSDIFKSKNHPVHKIRELCREILEMRK